MSTAAPSKFGVPAAGGCFQSFTDTINIGPTLNNHKFGIVHELGHAMTYYANPGGNIANCSNESVSCPSGSGSHRMSSAEFQSCAALEGAAHGYSAITFNDENEADCMMEKHYRVNWDGDNNALEPGELHVFSCEGGTTLTDPDVPDEDFLGNACLASGETNNRGSEYGCCRAIWDLSADDGVSFDTFLNIWDRADPHNWNANGNGTGDGYPAYRMSIAAGEISPAMGDKWDDNALENGIHR